MSNSENGALVIQEVGRIERLLWLERCVIREVRHAVDDENVATAAKVVDDDSWSTTRLRSGARQKAPRSSSTGKVLIFSDFLALALQLARLLHQPTEQIARSKPSLRANGPSGTCSFLSPVPPPAFPAIHPVQRIGTLFFSRPTAP